MNSHSFDEFLFRRDRERLCWFGKHTQTLTRLSPTMKPVANVFSKLIAPAIAERKIRIVLNASEKVLIMTQPWAADGVELWIASF